MASHPRFGAFWQFVGDVFGSCWGTFLKRFWKRSWGVFGNVVGTFFGTCWDVFGTCFWTVVGTVFGTFLGCFGLFTGHVFEYVFVLLVLLLTQFVFMCMIRSIINRISLLVYGFA